MGSTKAYWASRPFGYTDRYPLLDVGQVIMDVEVGSQRNDEKLLRLGLLREVTDKPVQCGKCGAWFAGESYRAMHGRRQHVDFVQSGRDEAAASFGPMLEKEERFKVPGERERPGLDRATAETVGRLKALEAADEFAEKNIPLHLDKTQASQDGKARRASR